MTASHRDRDAVTREGECRQSQSRAERIKECQGDLFADRTSAASMRANQLRFWFASMAYVLLCALRRLRLLKIGALVRTSVRRVTVAMASAFPNQSEFALAHARLAVERR